MNYRYHRRVADAGSTDDGGFPAALMAAPAFGWHRGGGCWKSKTVTGIMRKYSTRNAANQQKEEIMVALYWSTKAALCCLERYSGAKLQVGAAKSRWRRLNCSSNGHWIRNDRNSKYQCITRGSARGTALLRCAAFAWLESRTGFRNVMMPLRTNCCEEGLVSECALDLFSVHTKSGSSDLGGRETNEIKLQGLLVRHLNSQQERNRHVSQGNWEVVAFPGPAPFPSRRDEANYQNQNHMRPSKIAG